MGAQTDNDAFSENKNLSTVLSRIAIWEMDHGRGTCIYVCLSAAGRVLQVTWS